jgi:hypothetical protein
VEGEGGLGVEAGWGVVEAGWAAVAGWVEVGEGQVAVGRWVVGEAAAAQAIVAKQWQQQHHLQT